MIYAFAIPLILGVLIHSLLLIMKKYPGQAATNLWNSGIAALSVGCILRGALEIYGTTNSLCAVYPVAASILLTAALIMEIVRTKKKIIKAPDPFTYE